MITKPEKPYPEFPLTWHPCGQWVKKIKGKLYYFGTDATAALDNFTAQRDDLMAGKRPRTAHGPTVKEALNRFLATKETLLDANELSQRSWRDYRLTCERLLKSFGAGRHVETLSGEDFEQVRAKLATTRGPVALGNEIQRIRSVFKYAFDEGMIDQPVRFGVAFKKPSRMAIRKARNEAGERMIEAAELRTIIKAAGVPLKAMILLGINCGFGQTDVSNLPLSAIDLAGGWINYPRPKTAVARRCPLWPETVKSLKAAIRERPEPRGEADAGAVFLTRFGVRWVRMNSHAEKAAVPIDSVGLEFGKLLERIGIKRKGLGFYALRHVFRTIADGAKDQPAIDHIMGHADESMAAKYRERIDDKRLVAVSDVVKKWLGKLA
jgi:integrase